MSNRDAALRIMRGNRSRELPSSPVGKNSPYTLGVSPTVDEEMANKAASDLAPERSVVQLLLLPTPCLTSSSLIASDAMMTDI